MFTFDGMDRLDGLQGDLFQFRNSRYALDIDGIGLDDVRAETDFGQAALNRLLSTFESTLALVAGSFLHFNYGCFKSISPG